MLVSMVVSVINCKGQFFFYQSVAACKVPHRNLLNVYVLYLYMKYIRQIHQGSRKQLVFVINLSCPKYSQSVMHQNFQEDSIVHLLVMPVLFLIPSSQISYWLQLFFFSPNLLQFNQITTTGILGICTQMNSVL